MAFGDDIRPLLRTGDALARVGDHVGALDLYIRVARMYGSAGFPLKAVAVYRQIRDVVRQHAPQARAFENEAGTALSALYRTLGLVDDALAVENESGDSS